MEELVGYRLVGKGGTELAKWGGTAGRVPAVPNVLELPNGDRVHCPKVGESYGGWVLEEWLAEPLPPSPVELTVDEKLDAVLALLTEKGIVQQADLDAKVSMAVEAKAVEVNGPVVEVNGPSVKG